MISANRAIDSFLTIGPSDELFVEGISASDLAADYGTPLHVISEQRLRENYRRIRDAFRIRWEPGLDILYAIKANPALAIRRVLAQEGAGGDCLGLHELQASILAGTDASTLVLNGSNKTVEALTAAIRCGARINVDSLDEPALIAGLTDRLSARVRAGIRIKPNVEVFTDIPTALIGGTLKDYIEISKWGMPAEVALTAVERLLAIDSVELTAVHCHLGRHFANPSLFQLLARGVADVLATVHAATGWSPSILSLGGGFTQGRDPFFRNPEPGTPWPHPTDSFVSPVEEYAESLCATLEEELGRRAIPLPTLELEPGRYIAASAGLLLTRVGSVKRTSRRTWVEVDAAITHIGMSRSPRDAHAIVLVGKPETRREPVDVVGPLCVLDIIAEQVELPTLEPGDLLAILDTGAYADGEASNANSLGRPAVVLVSGADATLIRRRETFGDIFTRDVIPPRLWGP